MGDDGKLIAMFKKVHGELGQDYSLAVGSAYDQAIVLVMKNGCDYWHVTKSDLLFDYITKDWE